MDASGLVVRGRAETRALEKVLTWEKIGGAGFSCSKGRPHLSRDLLFSHLVGVSCVRPGIHLLLVSRRAGCEIGELVGNELLETVIRTKSSRG